jgi:hypothetical protein
MFCRTSGAWADFTGIRSSSYRLFFRRPLHICRMNQRRKAAAAAAAVQGALRTLIVGGAPRVMAIRRERNLDKPGLRPPGFRGS